MNRTTLFERGHISVSDFRCTAGPGAKPFAEQYACHSISYVRKGSFGCHNRGRFFELVAGSILVGHPGDDYTCTHDHVCGDECLSFFLDPELVEAIGDNRDIWQVGSVPPLPELMVLGELAQTAADGNSDIGLDEVGHLFAGRFVDVVAGRSPKSMTARSPISPTTSVSAISPISSAPSTAQRASRRGSSGRPRAATARFSKNASPCTD